MSTQASVAARNALDPTRLAAWGLGFALPLVLAFHGGGYDVVPRGEAGVAVWWIVLLGALTGLLSPTGCGRLAWAAVGALVAFGAWTLLGVTWSLSPERTVNEAGRLATYAGVLVLALSACRGGRWRAVVLGVASAICVVAALAVLSRARPGLLGSDDVPRFLAGTRSRLAYPLDYWNALAALMAMGIPLLLGFAVRARTTAASAVARHCRQTSARSWATAVPRS